MVSEYTLSVAYSTRRELRGEAEASGLGRDKLGCGHQTKSDDTALHCFRINGTSIYKC